MDMQPRKIDTTDDLRAAMNAPELQAANREFSRKYLKANRPKSLAVVILGVAAVLLLVSLSSHKASSVTPTLLRTTETVAVQVTADKKFSNTASAKDGQDLASLNTDALLALLDTMEVQRDSAADQSAPEAPYYRFSSDNGTHGTFSFFITQTGTLITDRHKAYHITSPTAKTVWSQLEALCGTAQ